MKKISRKLALTYIAINEIVNFPEKEINNILFAEYINEDGEWINYSDIYDDSVQSFLLHYFIEVRLIGYSNQYMENYLFDLYDEEFSVIGREDELEKCPCCGYLSLPNRGEYDVCPVCHWEDDGKPYDELDNYSSVNHSTLREYKEKFKEKRKKLKNIPYLD